MVFYGVFAAVIAGFLAAQPRVPLLVAWAPVLGLIGLWLAYRNDDKDQAGLLALLTIVSVAVTVGAIMVGAAIRRGRRGEP